MTFNFISLNRRGGLSWYSQDRTDLTKKKLVRENLMRTADKDKDNNRVVYTAIAAVIPNYEELETMKQCRSHLTYKCSSLMGLVCSYDSQIHLNRVDLIEVYPYASTKTEQAGKANNGSTTGEPSDKDSKGPDQLELKASIKFPFHGGSKISDIKVIPVVKLKRRVTGAISNLAVLSGTNGGLIVMGIQLCQDLSLKFELHLIQAIKIPNSEKPLILWFPPAKTLELETNIPILVFTGKCVRPYKIE